MEAQESVEQQTRKNRQIQEKVEKFKQRIQKSLKRPFPSIGLSQSGVSRKSRPLVLAAQQHRSLHYHVEPSRDIGQKQATIKNNIEFNQQKSALNYNSTLFKNLRQSNSFNDNNNYEQEQLGNSYSGISMGSYSGIDYGNSNTSTMNMLSKIDEVLENVRRVQGGDKKGTVVDDFISRKSALYQNSSGLSQSHGSEQAWQQGSSREWSANDSQTFGVSPLPSGRSSKLKTIQEQKQTLTIDREQQDSRQPRNGRKLKNIEKISENKQQPHKNKKYPPLASSAVTSVERQKKKLQEMMSEAMGSEYKQQADGIHQKQQIVFDLSDNESDADNSSHVIQKQPNSISARDVSIQADVSISAGKRQQRSELKSKLLQQKQSILQQINRINCRLAELQAVQQYGED